MIVKYRGFTLIEILVTLLVVLVGLMGGAGLIARSVQQEVEAYQRLQALNMLEDMVGRVNANRLVVACYSSGADGLTVGHGVTALPDCGQGSAEQRATANQDIRAWHSALLGAAQKNEDNESIGAMVGARGCIEQLDAVTRRYRISVAWQGLNETVAPADALNCGRNQYGDDKQRRVVTADVRIGDLS
ncbi:type IV pilus modification protein PilV [Spongiibacter sp.]|uniref:type IV pilus modification protein PilV n=1 Tax=Spongiibacter sp. TaxID=2024860 RepID=UPI0035681803